MHHNPIFIENLVYTYPDGTEALKGINLAIEATEKVALVGANGSGKSTLLLHFNGILPPQTGKITVGPYQVKPENLENIRKVKVVGIRHFVSLLIDFVEGIANR